MVSPRRRPTGFTLIELVITIAIIVMLLLVGMPFTSHWVDGTRQMRARSNLLEATGQARALAMRNPSGPPAVKAGSPYGIVRLGYAAGDAGNVLAVFRRAVDVDGADGDWETTPVWIGNIANPVGLQLKSVGSTDYAGVDEFKADPNDFSCVVFDSRGRQQTESGCASSLRQRVAVGVRNQEPVYVDLL